MTVGNQVLILQIEASLNTLLAEVPGALASVQIVPHGDSTGIEVVPANPKAAQITVIVPAKESSITLVAGRGSYFEIPEKGHRYTSLPFMEELKTICSAVIYGKLEESVLLDGEEVLQATGTIQLPRIATVRWKRLSFRLFRRTVRKIFQYESYAPGQRIS